MSLDNDNRKAKIISAIALVVALLSPVGMKLVAHPYGEFAAHISGVLWTVYIGVVIPIEDGGGMVPPTVNPSAGLLGLPLIALRLFFVYQLYRVYISKTSRSSALIWGLFSELYLVFVNIPSYSVSVVTGSIGGLFIPLPFLLLIGGLILWLVPPFVPSTPWQSSEPYATQE